MATFSAHAPAPTSRPGSLSVQEPWSIASSSLHLPGAGLHQSQTWQLPLEDLHHPAPACREELGQRLPSVSENIQHFKSFPGVRPCQSRDLSQLLVNSTSCWCSPETENEHPPPRPPCQLLPACKDLPQRDGVHGFSSAWKGLLQAHTQLYLLQARQFYSDSWETRNEGRSGAISH